MFVYIARFFMVENMHWFLFIGKNFMSFTLRFNGQSYVTETVGTWLLLVHISKNTFITTIYRKTTS